MERTASIQGATILAFPLGGRRGARAWAAQAADRNPVPEMVVDCDAWYHQAAVDEAKPRSDA
ncbi:DUF2735 domain-containing protein [Aureimonas flava]|uniref:DUF2735 domain-containing protein n=1 Tax=Aureimonas flava TaxID=2320271 RepID=A0A3A1WQT6_9HYPH|nr:DUF2735 domain-containing protein [Aureimonas flava]RIY03750.1 DUF2735 domain-containing protein [Aureimonas flava]